MLSVMWRGDVEATRTTSIHLIAVIQVLGIENHVSKITCCTNNDGVHLDIKR